MQNFRAKPDTAMRSRRRPGPGGVPGGDRGHPDGAGPEGAGAGAAEPGRPRGVPALLAAGVDDWGGVSPLTPDHVNPERPWPSLDRLRAVTASGGFELPGPADRAPGVRPWPASRGWTRGSPAMSPRWPTEDGLARPGVRPIGLPWQEPDGGFASVGPDRPAHRGRHRRAAPRTAARTSPTVYGDWDARAGDAAEARLPQAAGSRRDRRRRRSAALRAAEDDPAGLVRRARADADDRRGRPARTRCAGWPTTCAGTRSATRSPTW